MSRKVPSSRKQRTREHVLADLSVNHVERFILEQGHTVERVDRDYGYDLILVTYDQEGYVEPGLALLQLKASETLVSQGTHHVFDLDIRDYNLWHLEAMPVFLVLFDASKRRAYWLHVQRYFNEEPVRRPRKGARTVRVLVSARQVVTHRAVARMRGIKQAVLDHLQGGVHDV